jgi:hypothetical protein
MRRQADVSKTVAFPRVLVDEVEEIRQQEEEKTGLRLTWPNMLRSLVRRGLESLRAEAKRRTK